MRLSLRKVLLRAALCIVVAVVVFVIYILAEVLFIGSYLAQRGRTYEGAGRKWYDAMERGDAEAALHWANRMAYYASRRNPRRIPGSPTRAERCRAAAYELAGEYAQALALYVQFPDEHSFNYLSAPSSTARVYYKLGRKEEAFREYCRLASLQRAKPDFGSMKEDICGSQTYERAMFPFTTYDDFLRFIHEEWEALGKPEEYREDVEHLENIKYTSKEHEELWKKAMSEKDIKTARRSAEFLVLMVTPYRRCHWTSRYYSYLAAVHELAAEYDKALAVHAKCPPPSPGYDPRRDRRYVDFLSDVLSKPRIMYKLGKREEAFRGYCELARVWKEMQSKTWAKNEILGEEPWQKVLSPFNTYEEFLQFMRDEWERTGKAEQYREALEFLESLR